MDANWMVSNATPQKSVSKHETLNRAHGRWFLFTDCFATQLFPKEEKEKVNVVKLYVWNFHILYTLFTIWLLTLPACGETMVKTWLFFCWTRSPDQVHIVPKKSSSSKAVCCAQHLSSFSVQLPDTKVWTGGLVSTLFVFFWTKDQKERDQLQRLQFFPGFWQIFTFRSLYHFSFIVTSTFH